MAIQLTTYTKTEVNDTLATTDNQSTTYMKKKVNEALSAKVNQLTADTKTNVDNAWSDKLSQLTAGDPAKPLGAQIATGFPILTGKSCIKGLAVESHLTTSIVGGSTYLLLGMGTASRSSKANASDAYTENQIDNAIYLQRLIT